MTIEPLITSLGKEIFESIGKNSPSIFKKNYWNAKLMAWSMTQQELKTNLFRLVDVLPSLETEKAVVEHVRLYLGESLAMLHPLIGWASRAKPGSIRGKIMNFAVHKGVSEMAAQFIAGESPKKALPELKRLGKEGFLSTVDLLGEYSLSEKEALKYLERYQECLSVFHQNKYSPICISVKLSALYSQCSPLNLRKSVEVLSERLAQIVDHAIKVNATLYVDAEDTSHNPIIYDTFCKVFSDDKYKNFPLPGIVVQAYGKESKERITSLLEFAKQRGNPIAIRLVKGAYWDNETISCQQQSWESPLFAKKIETDANYEETSRYLLDNINHIFPAFGSHNVRSLSHACCYAKYKGISNGQFELQMLYGMAEPIAKAFVKQGYAVRLYVPLGEMIPGMGYLVRRLLENTSNESFLRHTFYDQKSVNELLKKPEVENSYAIHQS